MFPFNKPLASLGQLQSSDNAEIENELGMSKPEVANVMNGEDIFVINRFQDSDCNFTLNSDLNTRRGDCIDKFIHEQQTRPSIIGIVG